MTCDCTKQVSPTVNNYKHSETCQYKRQGLDCVDDCNTVKSCHYTSKVWTWKVAVNVLRLTNIQDKVWNWYSCVCTQASLKWKETTLDTNKQNVSSQIAAMNAATAQVVTLTSGECFVLCGFLIGRNTSDLCVSYKYLVLKCVKMYSLWICFPLWPWCSFISDTNSFPNLFNFIHLVRKKSIKNM